MRCAREFPARMSTSTISLRLFSSRLPLRLVERVVVRRAWRFEQAERDSICVRSNALASFGRCLVSVHI
jgi:hypothetical protein